MCLDIAIAQGCIAGANVCFIVAARSYLTRLPRVPFGALGSRIGILVCASVAMSSILLPSTGAVQSAVGQVAMASLRVAVDSLGGFSVCLICANRITENQIKGGAGNGVALIIAVLYSVMLPIGLLFNGPGADTQSVWHRAYVAAFVILVYTVLIASGGRALFVSVGRALVYGELSESTRRQLQERVLSIVHDIGRPLALISMHVNRLCDHLPAKGLTGIHARGLEQGVLELCSIIDAVRLRGRAWMSGVSDISRTLSRVSHVFDANTLISEAIMVLRASSVVSTYVSVGLARRTRIRCVAAEVIRAVLLILEGFVDEVKGVLRVSVETSSSAVGNVAGEVGVGGVVRIGITGIREGLLEVYRRALRDSEWLGASEGASGRKVVMAVMLLKQNGAEIEVENCAHGGTVVNAGVRVVIAFRQAADEVG